MKEVTEVQNEFNSQRSNPILESSNYTNQTPQFLKQAFNTPALYYLSSENSPTFKKIEQIMHSQNSIDNGSPTMMKRKSHHYINSPSSNMSMINEKAPNLGKGSHHRTFSGIVKTNRRKRNRVGSDPNSNGANGVNWNYDKLGHTVQKMKQ